MKNVLFIAPEFFGYYAAIERELEKAGAYVDRYRDIPSTDTLTRAVSRVSPKMIHHQTKRYFDDLMAETGGRSYDVVLILYGMTFSFSAEMIARLRQTQMQASFVLYLWDSIENLPHVREIFPYCDRICFFDPNDTERERGSSFSSEFLPLFYTDEYEKVAEASVKERYFASYIGTAHPQKLKAVNTMTEQLRKHDLPCYVFHYMPSRLKYYYHKVRSKEYRHVKLKDLNMKKLTTAQIAEIFSASRCILDAPQSGQAGLTMRSLEALGAKKKLMTSNPSVADYDFYDPTNVYIFREDKPIDFSNDFFTKPYRDLPENVYRKYSLSHWVSVILGESKN